MELEKAISQLKKFSLYYPDGYDEIEEHETKKAIEVVLKELDKKDDVIDEMAEYMAFPYKVSINKGRMPICIAIKDYFYKKVEKQE